MKCFRPRTLVTMQVCISFSHMRGMPDGMFRNKESEAPIIVVRLIKIIIITLVIIIVLILTLITTEMVIVQKM